MNNSESFLLLLKNLLNCTYEVLLPSQRYVSRSGSITSVGEERANLSTVVYL